MTTCDIGARLREAYGVEVPAGLISPVTGAGCEDARQVLGLVGRAHHGASWPGSG